MSLLSATREENAAHADEVDLYAYAETFWRHRWTLLWLIAIAVVVSGAVSLWVVPRTYEATSLIQVGDGDMSLGSLEVYRSLSLSHLVLARAGQQVGLNEAAIARLVEVEIIPKTDLVKLRVRAESPEKTKAIGDAWFRSFLTEVQGRWEKRLSGQVAIQMARVEGMQESLSSLLQPVVAGGLRGSLGSGFQFVIPGDYVTATGELKRLQKARTQVARGDLSDVTVLSSFRANRKPEAPRLVLNVSVASLLAVMVWVAGIFAVEGWRARRGVEG